MYSNAENEFRGDVRTLKMFCQAVQPVHVPALDEIEKQFLTEFDYVKEAKQMDEIRQNFIKGGLIKDGDKSRFRIPKPYLDFCTKGVLVMEELNGEKLADGLKRDMEREAARQGKTPEEFMEEQRELDRIAAEEGKLRKGPTAKEFDTYIAILDTKRKTKNLLAKLNNMFVAWWMPGSKYQDYESKDMLPANYAVLIDDIFQAFGHQVNILFLTHFYLLRIYLHFFSYLFNIYLCLLRFWLMDVLMVIHIQVIYSFLEIKAKICSLVSLITDK